MSILHVVVDSPVQELTLVSDGTALTAVWFAEHRHAPVVAGRGERVPLDAAPPVLALAVTQLEEYFAGGRTAFDLPTKASGTPFQHRVWAALTRIPYGSTWSYGALAVEVGSPGAARAVGLANGRNPLSIVVPCHRVIGSDGSITGYGGGEARKRTLLALERPAATDLLW